MKTKFLLISVFASIFCSCSNFEDLNTNPDSTTKVTPDMLATKAILNTFKVSGDAKAYIGRNTLSKYVAMTKDFPAEQYNSIGSCSYDSYTIIPNLNKMVEYSLNTKNESSYKGLASFIKAYNFYRLTMMTGDIPCTEAGQAIELTRSPKYDKQEDVLNSILELLDNANQEFTDAENFSGDFIFGGDTKKWKRATNNLRLKVLLSMSKKINNNQKELFAAIVNSGDIMGDNSDNMQMVYTTKTGTWHPLYNQTKFVPYTVISSFMVDELKRTNDRRLFYMAEPLNGKEGGNFDSYSGADPSSSIEALSLGHSNKEYSVINNRYIKEMAGDPLLILSYPEQCFIIAEAIELGWINGDAEKYYNNGVTAAMELFASYDKDNEYNYGMKIDNNYINTYLSGVAAYSDSKEDCLKQIWFQKYILKFMHDGFDPYLDFRRTSYPELPLNPETSQNIDNKNGFPMRWKYPDGEYQSNKENLDEALKRQFTDGYDGTNELMWILKD